MNRTRLLAIGAALIFTLAAAAQQPSSSGPVAGTTHEHGIPTAESHLKVLTEKLSLTSDQQVKPKPIVQEMHDAQEKLVKDQSLSPEDRMKGQHPIFMKADKQLREILTDEQKKKLDQLEEEMHPPAHGNGN